MPNTVALLNLFLQHSARTLASLMHFFDRYIIVEVLLLSGMLAVISKLFNGTQVSLFELLCNNLVNGVLSGHLMLFATKHIVKLAVKYRLNPGLLVFGNFEI